MSLHLLPSNHYLYDSSTSACCALSPFLHHVQRRSHCQALSASETLLKKNKTVKCLIPLEVLVARWWQHQTAVTEVIGSTTTWNSEVFLPVAKQPALTSFIHGRIQRFPIFHLSDCLYKIWLKRRGIETRKIHRILPIYSNNGGIYIEAPLKLFTNQLKGHWMWEGNHEASIW